LTIAKSVEQLQQQTVQENTDVPNVGPVKVVDRLLLAANASI
jgi:hypothetical protein